MVMEYLSGQDLSYVIRERGQLPIAEAVDLLLQACEAVAEAHTLGIVHRDLKPGNLFLTETSDGMPILKLLDFGISKTTARGDMSLPVDLAVTGSPHYMSPEQFESAGSVDARSDVWSLGIVLYELLTGSVPFTGKTTRSVRAAIRRGRYARLSKHRRDIPPAMEQMLAETLAVNRTKRLPSVEAFAAKLAPFGTDDARASRACIKRIVAYAKSAAWAAEQADAVGRPVETWDETNDSEAALARSQALTRPSPRRWLGWSALGVASCAAVLLAVWAPRGASSPASGPASASANGSSASPARRELFAPGVVCDDCNGLACNCVDER